MLKLFEYIFIRVYNGYNEWGEKDSPGVYAILFLALMQCLNIAAIVFLSFDFMHLGKIPIGNGSIYFIFLIITGLNYFYIYKVKGVQKLQIFWGEIDIIRKSCFRKYMYAYVIITILLFFLGIFLKNKIA